MGSWALGIISIALNFFGSFVITGITDYLSIHEILKMSATDRLGKILTAIYYGLVLIFSVFGFVRGVIELKSPKKRLAMIGLILCFAGIVASLFVGYVLLTFPLSKNQPDNTIINFAISWLHAQITIKFSN